MTIKEIFQTSSEGTSLSVQGWVRTKREAKNVVFVALNDGSMMQNIQLVIDPTQVSEELLKQVTTGASLQVEGTLVASQGAGQNLELQVASLVILGEADPEKYPLQPKRHSMEFLREIAHLRMRTNTFGAVFRIRHALSYAVHTFFHQKNFYWLHTPIITSADGEGAGEMFQITSLDLNNLPKDEQGNIDYKKDFFGQSTNLTVTGQLEGELGATALGNIYTFGPTFRAENSNTSRHLAEFWMIEPEMAFYTLQDNMDLAEAFIKYLIQYVLDHCKEDLEFLHNRWIQVRKGQKPSEILPPLEKLAAVLAEPFQRITYTEAIDILRNSKPNKKGRFTFPIDGWGVELQSEHERYLVEKHFKKPVIITDYPKEFKAFYMRQNEDGKTVAAMDVLIPGIGEVIGGSQREERLDLLINMMQEKGVPQEDLDWYLDTRRFGTVTHSGFGMGFERMVQFVTGMDNIRDVIPFPRVPGNAAF